MPKVQPIVEFLNCTFASNSEGMLPRANYNITKVNFFQGSCIFIFVLKSFMLILELENNELFNLHVEQLSSMEKTSSLLVNHLHNGISTPANDTNNIPICSRALSTMNPLKLGFVTPFFKIVALNFCQNIHWAFMSLDYISQITINITFQ
jgi:hypothetical protein